MDFGKFIIIAVIIGLILLQFIFNKPNPETKRREIVQSLLSEVKLNLALAATFSLRQKLKKFEMTSWQRSKTKLDFLEQSLQVALSDAFTIIEDFNRQIEAAKKYKSASYLANIPIDKLKEPLAKSEQGLIAVAGTKEPPPEYPGILDNLFGGRR